MLYQYSEIVFPMIVQTLSAIINNLSWKQEILSGLNCCFSKILNNTGIYFVLPCETLLGDFVEKTMKNLAPLP